VPDSTRSLDEPTRRVPLGVRIEAAGKHATVAAGGRAIVGSRDDCELVVSDDTVSRQHLEVRSEPAGIVLVDLGSKNGSWFGGNRFTQIVVRPPATIRIGGVELRIGAHEPAPRFGGMVGASLAMQRAFEMMSRVAVSDVAVLIRGETGTGKELAARAIHDGSPRSDKPYVVVDLAAIAPSMIESELFGHVRGAFTGATTDRAGVFEEARDGTVFLDEIGELDLASQPRLLRVLETGEVKRVGANRYTKTRARVIAATNRDLEAEIAAGRFRADLYHRLAGLTIELPPLRERGDDIPYLIAYLRERWPASLPPLDLPAPTIAAMQRYEWPGNVRQLVKVIERAALLAGGGAITPELLGVAPAAASAMPAAVPDGPIESFKVAKQRLVDAWEREYLETILDAAGGNITRAAEIAGVARVHLHRLLKKHALG